MGRALDNTGAASAIADSILNLFDGFGPHGMLAISYLLAITFAQFITNNGASVLMFPIVMATAEDLNVSPVPFVFTLMLGVGCTMLSPVAYQTNLMVYGPGGYKFLDYARLGLPVTILVGIGCVIIAPIFFPFLPGG